MAATRTPERVAPKHNARVHGLTASARRLDLKNAYEKRVLKLRQEWQIEAWQYFDEVPEIKFVTHFLGNLAAKIRLFAGTRTAADEDPVPVDDPDSTIDRVWADAANEELDRLRHERGGQSEICRMLNMNFEVTGECFLIGWAAWVETITDSDGMPQIVEHPEEWDVKSISEVSAKDDVWRVKSDPNAKDTDPAAVRVVDPAKGDAIIRMWLRHPQWANIADSLMRGVLGECRSLSTLSQQILAEANSHLAAPLLIMSNELSFGRDSGDDPPGEGQEDADDPFEDTLFNTLASAIEDPSSPASVSPLVVRGPDEHIKPDVLRTLSLARTSDAYLDDRIEKRVRRIARGLNVPVEVAEGHMETTFSNAQQINQDIFDQHMQPRCVLIADAIAHGFLRPNLLARGCPPEVAAEITVWFDAKALIRQPDSIEAANDGFDRGVISGAAWRAKKGFNDGDAPLRDEILERLVFLHSRAQLGPEVALALLKLMGVDIQVEAIPAPSQASTGANAAAILELLASVSNGHNNGNGSGHVLPLVAAPRALSAPIAAPGRQLVDLDIELRTRLLVAADAALERVLEKAGNRLRSKLSGELRTSVRHVPAYRVAATLGRAVIASVGAPEDELLQADWTALEGQFMAWGTATQEQALTIAARIVRGIPSGTRQVLMARQDEDLHAAWQWMRDALTGLAHEQLYNPDPNTPAIGESFSGRVPPGLVRLAVARAGGRRVGLSAGAWVALGDNGASDEPAGGIGVGEVTQQVLADGGAGIEGWRWVYGPAMRLRPFEPHEALAGVEFASFDDDVLANNEGFPDGDFYLPGDHDGCLCDVEPIILDPGEMGANPDGGDGGPADGSGSAPDVTGALTFDPEALNETQPILGVLDYDAWRQWKLDMQDVFTTFVEQQRTVLGNVDPYVESAWSSYIGTGYSPMNGLLRGTFTSDQATMEMIARRVENMDRAFAVAPNPVLHDEPVVAWRGVSHIPEGKVPKAGELMREPGYLSTSVSKNVASQFAGDWLYRIDLPAGTSRIHGTLSELELILPRGTTLRVLDVTPGSPGTAATGWTAIKGVIHAIVEGS